MVYIGVPVYTELHTDGFRSGNNGESTNYVLVDGSQGQERCVDMSF